jgi:hypothetical protein
MVPEFKYYEEVLRQVIREHRRPNQEVILVSATNPKDMDKIFSQMVANDIGVEGPFEDNSHHLAGMPLFLSYLFLQDKVTLVRNQVSRLRPPSVSSLVESLSTGLGFAKSANAEQEEIVYVHGPNEMTDSALTAYREELDRNNRTLQNSVPVRFVLWDKNSQSLSSVLQSAAVASEAVTSETVSRT